MAAGVRDEASALRRGGPVLGLVQVPKLAHEPPPLQSASDAHRLSVLGAGQAQTIGNLVSSHVPVVPNSQDGVPVESHVHRCNDAFSAVMLQVVGKTDIKAGNFLSKQNKSQYNH
jgi:hypothetical protein